MLIFIHVVFIVYLLAINAYGFMLIKLRKEREDTEDSTPNNGKLITTALLGGALGTFIACSSLNTDSTALYLWCFCPLSQCLTPLSFGKFTETISALLTNNI